MSESDKEWNALLKDKLDQELELDEIFVSEELIQKTLGMIKVSEEEDAKEKDLEEKEVKKQVKKQIKQEVKQKESKAKKSYFHRCFRNAKKLGGILAACLVLVVGVHLLQRGQSKNDSSISQDMEFETLENYTTTDSAPEESAEEESSEDAIVLGDAQDSTEEEKKSSSATDEKAEDGISSDSSSENASGSVMEDGDSYTLRGSDDSDSKKIAQILTLLTTNQVKLTASKSEADVRMTIYIEQSEESNMILYIKNDGMIQVVANEGETIQSDVTYELKEPEDFISQVIEIIEESE